MHIQYRQTRTPRRDAFGAFVCPAASRIGDA